MNLCNLIADLVLVTGNMCQTILRMAAMHRLDTLLANRMFTWSSIINSFAKNH